MNNPMVINVNTLPQVQKPLQNAQFYKQNPKEFLLEVLELEGKGEKLPEFKYRSIKINKQQVWECYCTFRNLDFGKRRLSKKEADKQVFISICDYFFIEYIYQGKNREQQIQKAKSLRKREIALDKFKDTITINNYDYIYLIDRENVLKYEHSKDPFIYSVDVVNIKSIPKSRAPQYLVVKNKIKDASDIYISYLCGYINSFLPHQKVVVVTKDHFAQILPHISENIKHQNPAQEHEDYEEIFKKNLMVQRNLQIIEGEKYTINDNTIESLAQEFEVQSLNGRNSSINSISDLGDCEEIEQNKEEEQKENGNNNDIIIQTSNQIQEEEKGKQNTFQTDDQRSYTNSDYENSEVNMDDNFDSDIDDEDLCDKKYHYGNDNENENDDRSSDGSGRKKNENMENMNEDQENQNQKAQQENNNILEDMNDETQEKQVKQDEGQKHINDSQQSSTIGKTKKESQEEVEDYKDNYSEGYEDQLDISVNST